MLLSKRCPLAPLFESLFPCASGKESAGSSREGREAGKKGNGDQSFSRRETCDSRGEINDEGKDQKKGRVLGKVAVAA